MPRILLIDDDVVFCRTVTKVLTKAGYDVDAVNDLPSAMERVEGEGPYFSVIVDFWLGQTDAVPILDEIAASMPQVPVILVSGGGGGVSLENTKAIGDISGVVSFLDKPFERQELLDVLNSLRK
jgi:two-component system phosphate regulon response regulator OmpR